MTAYKPTRVYCANSQNGTVLENGEISHPLRAAEISAARNVKVREQKLFAWKLLEFAYFDTFGTPFPNDLVIKDENGKWKSADDSFFFSLSHTDGACAVAIGRSICGVDIEGFDAERFNEPLAKKILCDVEFCEYQKLSCTEKSVFCAEKWTQKESIFKKTGGQSFLPKSICAKEHKVFTKKLDLCGKEFFLSVCSPDADDADYRII
ncbi:MAG: 4'-phosphopantetheinyl transferase superfamily protein [Ruminococcaceae bacterium]|nr:4'-phosphopantetheinyl transferase superfamily protein [Oscillospiraceae bacterium]